MCIRDSFIDSAEYPDRKGDGIVRELEGGIGADSLSATVSAANMSGENQSKSIECRCPSIMASAVPPAR